MSLHVLDTDTRTLLQEGQQPVSQRVMQLRLDDVAVTVLTVEEQLSGWYTQVRKAKRPDRLAWAYRRLAENVRFLSRLRILTFDESAIRRYEQLHKLKLKMGRTDVRIAATVLESDRG